MLSAIVQDARKLGLEWLLSSKELDKSVLVLVSCDTKMYKIIYRV